MGHRDTSMSIAFDGGTFQALQRMAAHSGISPEVLVSDIVARRLLDERFPATSLPGQERRKNPRCAITLPAVAQIETGRNDMHCRPVRIMDMSLGGMRLRLRHVSPELCATIRVAQQLEVVCNLPGLPSTLSLKCRVQRLEWAENLTLGASFQQDECCDVDILKTYLP